MTDPITQAREVYNGFFGDPEERNAGIVLATNLLRTLTSEGAEEACAQAVATEMRGAHKGGTTEQDYRAARAVISHLLAAALQKDTDHGE